MDSRAAEDKREKYPLASPASGFNSLNSGTLIPEIERDFVSLCVSSEQVL